MKKNNNQFRELQVPVSLFSPELLEYHKSFVKFLERILGELTILFL